LRSREIRFSTVHVAIHSQLTEDLGVGIVVIKRPMTLLVPLHLITALEEDPTAQLRVNGSTYEKAALVGSAELERDELALIRVRGRRRGPVGAIRIPRKEVRLRPGQTIALGRATTSDQPVRMGKIVEVRERTHGTTLVTDIEVQPGDSGSALISNRQLVAVCQGMLPSGDGGVAIAMPLSTSALERLRKLRRQSFLHQGLPVIAVLLLATALVLIGAFTRERVRVDPPSEPGAAQETPTTWGRSSTHLPLWPRLFIPSIQDPVSAAESAYARMSETGVAGERFPTLEWESDAANPVYVSYGLDHPKGEGANTLILGLSASAPVDVRVWATWEDSSCDGGRRSLEHERTLHVYPIPTSFILPYAGFTHETNGACAEPKEDPDWDRFSGVTLWPEAESGQVRFHRIDLVQVSDFIVEAGAEASQD